MVMVAGIAASVCGIRAPWVPGGCLPPGHHPNGRPMNLPTSSAHWYITHTATYGSPSLRLLLLQPCIEREACHDCGRCNDCWKKPANVAEIWYGGRRLRQRWPLPQEGLHDRVFSVIDNELNRYYALWPPRAGGRWSASKAPASCILISATNANLLPPHCCSCSSASHHYHRSPLSNVRHLPRPGQSTSAQQGRSTILCHYSSPSIDPEGS